jgi:hypothetical protein
MRYHTTKGESSLFDYHIYLAEQFPHILPSRPAFGWVATKLVTVRLGSDFTQRQQHVSLESFKRR